MYKALYRKWRPKLFEDVVSQPHVTRTLQNELKTGRVGHAYLFTGSRGTGKTTCAKIFAMAVNCEHPKEDGSPCLECTSCTGIEQGSLLDVAEIDAASNNGVEDIRKLREEANFTPAVCKYRVYIIDEVHMLSGSAFNALLKIMEEPPAHVIFILATTEVHKVPATILSRCQRFDFHRVTAEDIARRILYIADNEEFTITEEAAELIDSIPSIGNLWVADERQRELNYKQAVNSCDCREWIKIIKTLWLRNQQRLSQGKKITAMDRKYFKMAEDNLYGELSVSLEIPKEKMEEYITEKVGMQMQEDAESFMEYSIE